jgi:hypothetical protein
MEMILIILSILFISCNAEIKGSYPGYMKFRNYALRLLMSEDYNNLNRMIASQKIKIRYLKNITSKKILKIYDKALSKYYDSVINYSALSEDDKTIIETILSMSY